MFVTVCEGASEKTIEPQKTNERLSVAPAVR